MWQSCHVDKTNWSHNLTGLTLPGPVSFGECEMSHPDFDRKSGTFTCSRSGLYREDGMAMNMEFCPTKVKGWVYAEFHSNPYKTYCVYIILKDIYSYIEMNQNF